MANITCPLERLSERVYSAMRQYTKEAKEDDGQIDAEEHAFINELRAISNALIDRSALRKLGRHIDQMDEITDYTIRLARAADIGLVDLETERKKRHSNVVQFRTRQEAG